MAVNQHFLQTFYVETFREIAIKHCCAAADPEFSYTQLKPDDSEYLAVNRRERRLYLENGFFVQKVIQTTAKPYITLTVRI